MHRVLRYCVVLLIGATLSNTAVAGDAGGNPTEEQITRLLYSQEELLATGGRHLVYKAWPKFAGRYIVASYSEPKSNSLVPLSGLEPLPVEVAIVQYKGAIPTVISRRTFGYKGFPFAEKLQIDTANYQIADTVTAFGLRAHGRDAGSGFEYHYESLDLYTVRSNGIDHVAGNLTFGSGGLFESYNENSYCNNPNFCDLVWSEEIQKTILIVMPNKTNEYFDMLAKTTKTEKSGRLDESDKSAKPAVRTETTTHVFRWDGEKYQGE